MKGILKEKIIKILLGLLFFGIIGYNFYVANSLRYETEGDAADFVHLGTSLAKVQKYGHLEIPNGIVQAFEENNISTTNYNFKGHSTWRPPAWPFIIAGVFLLFGFNLTYLLIVKFLLHLIGTFIFYRTLRILQFKHLLIAMGTFLYGISPAWQLYSRVFLSEPITLFFITLWIYLLIRFLKDRVNWWPQALVAGILVLCHPYYLFLPFSVWLIFAIRKQITLKIFLLSFGLYAAVISTWIIRNFLVLDTSEVVLTTSSGAVMAKGWNQLVFKKHTNTKGDLADEALVLEDYNYQRQNSFDEVERMKLYKDASLHYIRTNPEQIFPIIGKKLKSAFNPFPETPRPGILETGRWLFQFLALLALLYLLLLSKNKLITSMAWGLVVSTIGITILTYSGFRFRMPQVGLELLLITFTLRDIFSEKSH